MNNLSENIKAIKELRAFDMLLAPTIFLSSIAPGFLAIFHYKIDLFKDMETVKLIMLAMAISVPSLVCVFIGMAIAKKAFGGKLEGVVDIFAVALVSAFLQYLCLLISYKEQFFGYAHNLVLVHLGAFVGPYFFEAILSIAKYFKNKV